MPKTLTESITTLCPSCGQATLVVDSTGALLCSFFQCPQPVVSLGDALMRNVAFLARIRLAAFATIAGEAIFQAHRVKADPTITETLASLQAYLAVALADATTSLDEIRKIAGACVLCMETNGIKPRLDGGPVAVPPPNV